MNSSKPNIFLGAHTSANGGAYCALVEGQKIGANAIQFFTANQKSWYSKPLTEEAQLLWKQKREETGIAHIMSHASYLINLGPPREEVLLKSRHAFQREIERCHLLDVNYLNFHPGAALNGTEEACLETIIESLLELEKYVLQGNTLLLLETTAGQGSCVGHQFEHLSYIIERVKSHFPIGVCIDTCHIFAAGYDIRTEKDWLQTIADFDKNIGLEHLKAFHVNDSMKGLGTRVDRHAPLGKGEIGMDSFRFLMTHPQFQHLPKYLETPGGVEDWPTEIQILRKLAEAS